MDNGLYSALTVAEYIIAHENEKNRPISNLRLQKLLYFVQALFLVSEDRPCFTDEIEAWDFGPVVPVVYHEYKIYGSTQIPYRKNRRGALNTIKQNYKQLIDMLLDYFSNTSTRDLVSITHRQRPWREAYSRPFDNRISNTAIKSFFERKEK